MISIRFWLLKKLFKRLIKQGPQHEFNIQRCYHLLYEAASEEFTEDVPSELNSYMNEQYLRSRNQRQKFRMSASIHRHCPKCHGIHRTFLGTEANIGIEELNLWKCNECGIIYDGPLEPYDDDHIEMPKQIDELVDM